MGGMLDNDSRAEFAPGFAPVVGKNKLVIDAHGNVIAVLVPEKIKGRVVVVVHVTGGGKLKPAKSG